MITHFGFNDQVTYPFRDLRVDMHTRNSWYMI